jgi:hypothetical protein
MGMAPCPMVSWATPSVKGGMELHARISVNRCQEHTVVCVGLADDGAGVLDEAMIA